MIIKKSVGSVIIALLLAIGVFTFILGIIPQKISQTNQNIKASAIPKAVAPEGWKVYENKTLGFSFLIPKDFDVEANGQYSVIAKHPTSSSRVGPTEFFYVSVVPESLSHSEAGEVYNYSYSFYQKMISIPVGEIKNLSENQGQKDWYMYERMGDQEVGGRTAKVFLNQRPWEFPNGIWEYRYIFSLPEKIILAGGYITGGPSDTPLSLPTFQKIVDSLVISN